MRAVDWVLVPSTWWEIFCLVVSEAWMFGRPVIASAIAGLKERVRPNVNGFTFPARDSRALADLLATLAGNEQQWLKVNRLIEQPWTETEMLEAHESMWRETQEKRDAERMPQARKSQSRKRQNANLEKHAVPVV